MEHQCTSPKCLITESVKSKNMSSLADLLESVGADSILTVVIRVTVVIRLHLTC